MTAFLLISTGILLLIAVPIGMAMGTASLLTILHMPDNPGPCKPFRLPSGGRRAAGSLEKWSRCRWHLRLSLPTSS